MLIVRFPGNVVTMATLPPPPSMLLRFWVIRRNGINQKCLKKDVKTSPKTFLPNGTITWNTWIKTKLFKSSTVGHNQINSYESPERFVVNCKCLPSLMFQPTMLVNMVTTVSMSWCKSFWRTTLRPTSMKLEREPSHTASPCIIDWKELQ